MKVRQLMQKELISILPSATIHDAAMKMKENNIGSVLIVDDGGKLKGIVTDRDITLAVAADSKDPGKTFASDIMSGDPVSIPSDADVNYALRIMSDSNVRRLPVCEHERVIGILSSADVAGEIKEEITQFLGLEQAFAKHH
ncbi:MAG: CBS domain-containing protein [Nitrospiraceae bacterium]|nr:MAG: CBS domain-containing protein [Nitrospiraceae bacterium]